MPSRTFIGVRAKFGELNPWALQPKSFFFGLFSVDAWAYRCVLSKAKIDLMCADLPRVEYAKTDKDGNVIKKKDASYDDVVAANQAILDRLKAKRAAEQNSSVGEKISLTNLLEGK